MRQIKKMLVFLLASLLIFTLVSCGNKANSIKKAFEKADYEVASLAGDDEDVAGLIALLGLSKEAVAEYEFIVCNEKEEGSTASGLGGFLEDLGNAFDKALPDAVIIKFPSTGELKDFFTVTDANGNKDTSHYDLANDNGQINGNCYLIVGGEAEKDIFK